MEIFFIRRILISLCRSHGLDLFRKDLLNTYDYTEDGAFARDLYALAVTGWEIICRQHSWSNMSTEEIISNVCDLNNRPIWTRHSKIGWEYLIENLWANEKLMTLTDVLVALDPDEHQK